MTIQIRALKKGLRVLNRKYFHLKRVERGLLVRISWLDQFRPSVEPILTLKGTQRTINVKF